MRNFWEQYSRDEAIFDQQVKKGISIEIKLGFTESATLLQRHYGGCSADKMKRYLPLWRENRDKFFYYHPKVKKKHVEQFNVDYARELKRKECDEFRLAQTILKKESALPSPPAGYRWIYDPGALHLKDEDTKTYQLWHKKYGVLWMDDFWVADFFKKGNLDCYGHLSEVDELLSEDPDLFKNSCTPLDAARIVRRGEAFDTSYSLMVNDGRCAFYEDTVEFYGVCDEIRKRRRETCWRVSALKYPYKTLDGGGYGSTWICKKTGEQI